MKKDLSIVTVNLLYTFLALELALYPLNSKQYFILEYYFFIHKIFLKEFFVMARNLMEPKRENRINLDQLKNKLIEDKNIFTLTISDEIDDELVKCLIELENKKEFQKYIKDFGSYIDRIRNLKEFIKVKEIRMLIAHSDKCSFQKKLLNFDDLNKLEEMLIDIGLKLTELKYKLNAKTSLEIDNIYSFSKTYAKNFWETLIAGYNLLNK